jgi:type II secretory pathway component PulF
MKLSAQIEIFPHLSLMDRFIFTKHLSVMLKAGISLSESLATLEEQAKSSFTKKLIADISNDVRNGQQLSKALTKFPKYFDKFYVSLVKMGEESGTLEINLEYLAQKLDKDHQMKSKIQSVMLYPAIVLTTGAVIGLGLSVFVLPKMSELFESMEVKLPLATRILMFAADIAKKYNIFIVAGAALFLLLFNIFVKLRPIKPYWHRFLLSLPLLGTFFRNVQMAAFCRNLGIMLKSGLPITTSLNVIYESMGNLVFKKYAENMMSAVNKGKPLGGELSTKRYPLITPLVAKMISVGEKSGKLDEMLLYLGDFYETESDNTAKNFSTVLEPLLLIIIGLFVAFIAMAIISPIYQFTGSINRQ